MEKSKVVRLQLWILGAVTVLLLMRVVSMPVPEKSEAVDAVKLDREEVVIKVPSDEKGDSRVLRIEVNTEGLTVTEQGRKSQPLELNRIDASKTILTLNELGNGVDRTERFSIDEPADIHIIALGEISKSGNKYDYGVITNASTGDVVWEMHLNNTQPAGGHISNRLFNDRVRLQPGTYDVRFVTDETHAFGSFDALPPATPEAWGITIIRG